MREAKSERVMSDAVGEQINRRDEGEVDDIRILAELLCDIVRAEFDLAIQRYEERIRTLEGKLGIDNSEYVRRYEEKIEGEAEDGWIKRHPSLAGHLIDVSKTPKVRKVVQEFEAE